VLEALARLGATTRLVDAAEVPSRWRLSLGDEPAGWTLGREGEPPLRGGDVAAVWWRRVRAPQVNRLLRPAEAARAAAAWGTALAALWTGLPARFVNPPLAEEAAGLKPLQLAVARRAGLLVPATLVTSDPEAARAFLAGLGGATAVLKPLVARDQADFTRLLPADGAGLEPLRLAPAILQAYVPGVDVRVTAVGARLFACEIDARATSSPHDFRAVYQAARVAPCEVPAAVAGPLNRLLADLGLAYGAADFRVDERSGAWHFLEVNPSGQWLGFEERAGLPITQAVAELLAGVGG
jgi:glutathione synthase/RimK-type ligase-like ATP-grasp enzyme